MPWFPPQAAKAQKLGIVTALIGLAARNLTTMGAGFLAASRQSMFTDFTRVNTIKVDRRTNTMKIRFSYLFHNQIYTAPEDFDFVLDFIIRQVGTDVLIKGR